ncbi:uncharacterized protein LOC134288752 [Aedes albopictus]|uniref:Endonuclease n=1 Tax=Aedes albopictus TaxID=7160 RepID=A0ABM1XTI5_AEDAL
MPPKRTPVKKMPDPAEDGELRALFLNRGAAQRNVSRIQTILEQVEADNVELTSAKIKVYQRSVENAHTEYTRFHQQIIATSPSDGLEEQEECYLKFLDLYEEVSVLLESWSEKLNAPATQQPPCATTNQQPIIVQSQSFRAPLPTFDGRYEAWPRFKAMFQDLMQRSSDSDAVKLYHLENSLKGEATGVIDLETLQNNNYQRAWDILEERFGNKRLIVESHILGLLNMKRMGKKSSKDLRSLIDECTRHVENLVKLGQPLLGMSELLVVTVLTRALDDQTRELWEASIDQTELPEYEQTIEFLKQRCVILERCEKSAPIVSPNPKVSNQKPPGSKLAPSKTSHAAAVTSEYMCDFCSGQHQNYKCSNFLKMSVDQRQAKVKEVNLCFNCLRKGHRGAACSSDKSCSKCSKKHHTLLHFEREKPEVKPTDAPKTPEGKPVPAVQPVNTSCSSSIPPPGKQVFLMTAMVNLTAKNGQVHRVRALLDSGSQINVISESVVQRLKLPKQPANVPVIGVGGNKSKMHHKVVVRMTSNYSDYAVNVECLTTPKVAGTVPPVSVNIDTWNIPPGILLADAAFYCPNEIEMLIGAGLFFDVLKQGQIKLSSTLPTLYETQFGWVVAGTYDDQADDRPVCANVVVNDGLEECLKRFFDQEEIVEPAMTSTEEERFEEHFKQTYRRDDTGRFVVQLPFRDSVSQLSNSRSLAMKRFLLLEKRLAKNPELKNQYTEFIDEYRALGHCREIQEDEDPPGTQAYYLPHHCVLKPSSSSTKLRVVFDATAKASGLSLNDVLMTGPNSQSELFTIVMRFRTHPIVFSADVSKMYRQVLVDPSQTRYQRIFWRNNPSEALKVFELLTVTYGTSSASFLAVRSLIQLARDESTNYPTAAEIILDDSYMDDILSGADSVNEAIKLRSDIEELMLKGGFPVRKWCSNSEELLDSVPEEDREKLVPIHDSSANQAIKALGLMWDPRRDLFLFCQSADTTNPGAVVTKRRVLSQIARLFDPLGLVAPVIVEAKMIMQCLWASKLGWDDTLDDELLQRWNTFRTSLDHITDLEIPRCVVDTEREVLEIHGFADASKSAYGACVYIRCVRRDGSAVAHLLCSKSKVAPLREMTIPRLELCAALLLAKLVAKVAPTLKLSFDEVKLWSDSKIVLAWINKPLDRLQVYVRNRVAQIKHLTDRYQWSYVNTLNNPADIVSRGMPPDLLKQCSLWWSGPTFLSTTEYEVEAITEIPECEIPELREVIIANPAIESEPVFERFSSFTKLQRVLAQVVRFVRLVRTPKEQRMLSSALTVQDMRRAEISIVRILQQSELHEEIQSIQRGNFPKRMANLQPFIDDEGLLRVGGRLQNSKLPFEAKHQLLLPRKHRVTEMLIRKYHEDRLHEGQSGLLAAIRQKFWLTNARSAIRKVIHDCVKCFRTKPRSIQPLMGVLPEARVTEHAPFELTGVDYAGPILVKEGKRKPKVVKAYISLFVCLSTKAIHLELVSDLTSDAFLAALDRFINRRGLVRKLFSDNGTNFVGALKELRHLRDMFNDQVERNKINDFLIGREVEWDFIPPRSPNFGGLWEAGVKIVKSHLTRTLGNTTLTFEQLSTVLTHIEAIVNSRPLYSTSDDPNDPQPISPAHLMLGRPMEPVIKPSYLDVPANRLTKWQYLNQMRDHFWKKWSREYLSTLQSRAKWTKKQPNVRVDTVVLLAEDNQPAQTWKLGRIIAVYPGKDGIVRVADVKTTTGVYRRAVSKLAPLPLQETDEQQSSKLELHSNGRDYVRAHALPMKAAACEAVRALTPINASDSSSTTDAALTHSPEPTEQKLPALRESECCELQTLSSAADRCRSRHHHHHHLSLAW